MATSAQTNGVGLDNGHEITPMDVYTSEPGGPKAQAQAKVDSYSDKPKKFPRLSRPVELLRTEYDVVVIGSGYGGGVAASRMSRGGQSVCMLERGRERWPGEYPTTLAETLPQLHISGDFHPDYANKGMPVDSGDPIGLYHLIVGEGQNAFVANGLGGTSLLNANVFLRADEGTMSLNAWPAELQKKGALEKYYKRAESVLQPEAYPSQYPRLPKLDLLERQAKALGVEDSFYRVPQTTRFEDGPNSTGVEMKASALTGMDSTGVNDGSKSSTLVNYVSDSWNWGAEIFCECEVRYIKKAKQGGYNVFFAWHGAKRANFKQNIYEDLMWVHAKKMVFLGAGSLGTTELLLRTKNAGLPMSENVGTGMSGNGDILAFGYNTNDNVNGIGRAVPSPEKPIGPTITGIIDRRDQLNPLDGFVIEEGAVPAALADFLQSMLHAMPGKIYPRSNTFPQQLHRQLASIGSRVFGPYYPKGSIERTQIYLIMSHDSNQAIMTLVEDKPVLKFLGVGRSEHVTKLNDILAQATNAVGGTYVNSPFFAALGQQEITVHPIGGACISADGSADFGATTHLGELLTGVDHEYHDGLVVVDGALVPTALGVNPFATITALAERAVEGVAKKFKVNIDYHTKNGLLDLFKAPRHQRHVNDPSFKKAEALIRRAQDDEATGVEFTEVMSGFIHIGGDIDDFVVATRTARGACQNARFFLTMHAWELDSLLLNDKHEGMLTGTFTHGSLPASPYIIARGSFQLFNDDLRAPDTTNLTYDFDMVGTDGSKLHFHAYKIVNTSAAGSFWSVWKATSTLYVSITEQTLQDPEAPIAKGMLHISPTDLIAELSTFTSSAPSITSRVLSTGRFLGYFASNVASVYLGPLAALQWPTPTYSGYYDKASPDGTYKIKAEDGVESTLNRWDARTGSNVVPTSVLFVPGAAVDHQIFALPTIKENAIEYFTSKGYNCFAVTHRVGKTMEAQKGWTTYDARLDVKAALQFIRDNNTADDQVYVICHCAGSVAFSSGILDGSISSEWIKGVTASNVFFNPIFAPVNMFKATLPVPLATVYSTLIGKWFSCTSTKDDSLVQLLLNQILRFYPAGTKSELCNSVVCHRSELVFGRLWTHRNLNSATHSQLHRFLGGTSMPSLAHLVAMGSRGVALTNSLQSLVSDSNLSNFEGIPILLFSGSENAVYKPENTDVSYSRLRDRFGAMNYERTVFQGRGHLDCWMSETAVKDVWPRVLRHVDKICARGRPKPRLEGKAEVDGLKAQAPMLGKDVRFAGSDDAYFHAAGVGKEEK